MPQNAIYFFSSHENINERVWEMFLAEIHGNQYVFIISIL